MSALRARKLTAQQAGSLWAEFYEAYGPEVMDAAYGWGSPTARQMRPGEKVWEFFSDTARIGWGLCALNTRDSDDDEAELVVGVFPDHRGRGHRHAIFDWMSRWARSRGASSAKIIVFKDNEVHFDRTMDEALNDSSCPWTWAGDVWLPAPGYGIFVRDLTDLASEPGVALKEAA